MTARARNVLLIFAGDFKGKSACWLRARNVSLNSATFYDLRNSLAPAMNHCTKQCSRCDFSGVMWVMSTTCRWRKVGHTESYRAFTSVAPPKVCQMPKHQHWEWGISWVFLCIAVIVVYNPYMTRKNIDLLFLFWDIPYLYYLILSQWEFQDPKMEVLYHIRPYFVGIFTYIGLT